MSTQTIFFFAMGVFALMVIGIFLTMREFNRLTEEPSTRKGRRQGRRHKHRSMPAQDTA